MKNTMTLNTVRKTLALSCVFVALTATTNAQADVACGEGKITEIQEGGWNTNDLMIKIENPVAAGLLYQGYVRYSATALNAERLRGIRAVAYLAMAGEKTVIAYSHTSNCKPADQLGVLK